MVRSNSLSVSCWCFAVFNFYWAGYSVAVNQTSQFQHCPTDADWTAVKRILRYIKHILHFGIKLQSAALLSTRLSQIHWAGCSDDRRSPTGFCVFLGSSLISCWQKSSLLVLAQVRKPNIVHLCPLLPKSLGYFYFSRSITSVFHKFRLSSGIILVQLILLVIWFFMDEPNILSLTITCLQDVAHSMCFYKGSDRGHLHKRFAKD